MTTLRNQQVKHCRNDLLLIISTYYVVWSLKSIGYYTCRKRSPKDFSIFMIGLKISQTASRFGMRAQKNFHVTKCLSLEMSNMLTSRHGSIAQHPGSEYVHKRIVSNVFPPVKCSLMTIKVRSRVGDCSTHGMVSTFCLKQPLLC